MQLAAAFGKDRRRRLSRQEASELFARAKGLCERCGAALGVDWQQAHLVAHTNGGATSLTQMQAWCRDCNLAQGARDAIEHPLLTPREWQRQAMDVVLKRLWQTGSATVHAAPGAGKTFFAGLLFRHLRAADLVDRMVVVVPNRALVRQWTEALGTALEVHLDYEPRDGFLEHADTVGAVVTYQGLTSAADGHIAQMAGGRTLLVLDEVHHVGDQKAWGNAVSRIVGSADSDEGPHPAGVLNMTGTLFRSSGARKIGTVRYVQITDGGVAKFQADADFSVPASMLIGVELRRPDLYSYDGHVELIDIKEERVIAGDIADLEAGAQVNTAIRQGFKSPALVHEFAKEALTLLAQQLATLDNREPLKLLWVAEDQKAARLAAEQIDKAAGKPFAKLVISDEPGALNTLRAAAKSPHSCAIVAVKMVTEGFDCPQVSVIAYASATTAVLFLAQTMARAMRVTGTERADGMMLPAQILIPDNRTLRKAFTEALVGHFHILEVPEETEGPGGEGGPGGSGIRLPRYTLTDISTLDLRSATVLGEQDATVNRDELQAALAVCLELSIPEPFGLRVAVAARRLAPSLALYRKKSHDESAGVQERAADPRSLNKARRARINGLVGWMSNHLEHDGRYATIGVFQGMANDAAGIPTGGRDQGTPEQLGLCEDWMLAQIREHGRSYGCATPTAARSDPV